MPTTIYEKSSTNRGSKHYWRDVGDFDDSLIPENMKRKSPAKLPEASELDVVRHYTNLSRKNFSIDGEFYPLGSCTMKYNPRGVHKLATSTSALSRHPLAPENFSQGYLRCMYDLQNYLADITGMDEVSLTPMAGAQGEFAGVAMIKSYHEKNGNSHKNEMLIPDAAHGTNPASACMCGYKIKEVKSLANGDLDLEDLKEKLSENTAGLMLTNPSTLGLFERQIKEITDLVHGSGGLLYYDGANLNAIVGRSRPADMGFDVMHLNLHKTFATPHGGGGPGAGPVACNQKLSEFLPTPIVGHSEQGYYWKTKEKMPNSIGRLSTFMGNAGVLLRAYFYIRILGREGLREVSNSATLNANYLHAHFKDMKLGVAFPERRATHEFIVSFKELAKENGINALDMAKKLLEYKIHAPTMYFPLTVPECWLIEPTDTESLETLDRFISVVGEIFNLAKDSAADFKSSPRNTEVGRVDEVYAVRNLNVRIPKETLA